jgi:hypothetical protein
MGSFKRRQVSTMERVAAMRGPAILPQVGLVVLAATIVHLNSNRPRKLPGDQLVETRWIRVIFSVADG